MIHAVGYVRVSTGEQYATIDEQRAKIEEVCRERGWKLVKVCYDRGVSGAIDPFKRRGFAECVETLAKLGGGIIVVYAFDRVARMDLFELSRIMNRLLEMNILLYSAREKWLFDLVRQNPIIGKQMFANIASVAELERELISERVRLAMENPEVRRKFEERFREATGLTLTKDVSPDIARRVVELRKAGRTIREIAKELNLSTYKVMKILVSNGLVQLAPDRCPRCLRRVEVKNVLGIVKIYYCRKCGYKRVETIEI